MFIYDGSTTILTDANLNSNATTNTVFYDQTDFWKSRLVCAACMHGYKPVYDNTLHHIKSCTAITNCNLLTAK